MVLTVAMCILKSSNDGYEEEKENSIFLYLLTFQSPGYSKETDEIEPVI